MLISDTQVVKVGIAQMAIAISPNSIRTSGLGSCVGVVIYDESKKMAGLVHVMLPESKLGRGDSINEAKFADTGIPAMVNQLKQKGAQLYKLKAKIADLMRSGHPVNRTAIGSSLSIGAFVTPDLRPYGFRRPHGEMRYVLSAKP